MELGLERLNLDEEVKLTPEEECIEDLALMPNMSLFTTVENLNALNALLVNVTDREQLRAYLAQDPILMQHLGMESATWDTNLATLEGVAMEGLWKDFLLYGPLGLILGPFARSSARIVRGCEAGLKALAKETEEEISAMMNGKFAGTIGSFIHALPNYNDYVKDIKVIETLLKASSDGIKNIKAFSVEKTMAQLHALNVNARSADKISGKEETMDFGDLFDIDTAIERQRREGTTVGKRGWVYPILKPTFSNMIVLLGRIDAITAVNAQAKGKLYTESNKLTPEQITDMTKKFKFIEVMVKAALRETQQIGRGVAGLGFRLNGSWFIKQ